MAQVVVELTGDEAKLLRSLQKVVEQNTKTKDSFKGLAKDSTDSTNLLRASVSRLGSEVAGIALGYASIGTAISAVSSAQEVMNEKTRATLALTLDIAKAQQDASKNLAGKTTQEISETLTKAVPEIALRANFSDIPKLSKAVGATSSIVSDQQAISAVEVSANMTQLNKEQLETTATSVADIMKATGLQSGKDVMSLLLSAGTVWRPEDMPKIAEASVKSIYANIMASPNQAPVEAAKDAMALTGVFSKVDPSGKAAATASTQFIGLMQETFNPSQDQTIKRDERIAELLKEQSITIEEQVAIDRANLSVRQKQAIVNRVNPNDTSIGAQDARIDLAEAQSALTKATKSATLNEKETEELKRLQTQKQYASMDPGELAGRMELTGKSPELNRIAEEMLSGEAVMKPIAAGFLNPNSVHMKEFLKNRESITTDNNVYDDSVKSMYATPQQRIAMSNEAVDTGIAVTRMKNVPGATIGSMASIENKALSETSIDYASSFETMLTRNFRGDLSQRDLGVNATYSAEKLRDRAKYLDTMSGRNVTDELITNLQLLTKAIGEIANTANASRPLPQNELQKLVDIQSETKNILDRRLNQAGPMPQQIRAQVEQRNE